MNDQNLVNTQFQADQIAWMQKVAEEKFRMRGRGALPHVIRTCVDLVIENNLLEKINNTNIQKSQSSSG